MEQSYVSPGPAASELMGSMQSPQQLETQGALKAPFPQYQPLAIGSVDGAAIGDWQ